MHGGDKPWSGGVGLAGAVPRARGPGASPRLPAEGDAWLHPTGRPRAQSDKEHRSRQLEALAEDEGPAPPGRAQAGAWAGRWEQVLGSAPPLAGREGTGARRCHPKTPSHQGPLTTTHSYIQFLPGLPPAKTFN